MLWLWTNWADILKEYSMCCCFGGDEATLGYYPGRLRFLFLAEDRCTNHSFSLIPKSFLQVFTTSSSLTPSGVCVYRAFGASSSRQQSCNIDQNVSLFSMILTSRAGSMRAGAKPWRPHLLQVSTTHDRQPICNALRTILSSCAAPLSPCIHKWLSHSVTCTWPKSGTVCSLWQE